MQILRLALHHFRQALVLVVKFGCIDNIILSLLYHDTTIYCRAKTNILNVNEQIIFLKNEYSNILYIISISLITRAQEGLHNWSNKT